MLRNDLGALDIRCAKSPLDPLPLLPQKNQPAGRALCSPAGKQPEPGGDIPRNRILLEESVQSRFSLIKYTLLKDSVQCRFLLIKLSLTER